ncbi:MAG TPA: hypothetical protein VF475_07860 [Sphingobium sp.]
MVADLTRYSACSVHPDTPEKPVPDSKAAAARQSRPARNTVHQVDPTGDEPVRLFVWASA